ncbi:MAG: hypothetical protein KTR29_21475 [Rhodothermaceae bacterium]|nr:hypothetical protein [Rhodothermaceae bacterium]
MSFKKIAVPSLCLAALCVLVVTSGFQLSTQDASETPVYSYASKVVSGNTIHYYSPSVDGDPLGWTGGSPSAAFVADCFCLDMGHGNYKTATNGSSGNGAYFTYTSGSVGISTSGSYIDYVKISCNTGGGNP